jgi:membrane protein implicated in regulation of membrane protease activity
VLLAWVIVGVVLLLVEMHNLAFFAVFAAIGAFAAAGVAAVAPDAIAAQAVVASALGLSGMVAVRPWVSRAIDARRTGEVIRGVHGGIVGTEGVTLDEVGDAHHAGHVRLTGERWLAVSGGGQRIPAGVPVIVTAVRGTTLVVWPAEIDSHEIGPVGPGEAPDGAEGRKQ